MGSSANRTAAQAASSTSASLHNDRRVLLATAAGAWERDDDAAALVDALRDVRVDARPAVWDDPEVDWSAADAVIVRSTWDYARRRDEFLAWAERVAALTTLHNPADVLRWNTDKRYLHDLARAGLPVVATQFLDSDATDDEIRSTMASFAAAGGDWVVKPSVSAGSLDTERFSPDRVDDATALARSVAASSRTTMVQPYLVGVDDVGETGLLFFDGEFSHAFFKAPMLPAGGAGGRAGEWDNSPGALFRDERIAPRIPEAGQRRLAGEVVAHVSDRFGAPPLYARVDLVPGDDGAPVLLELELAEPSWFLATDDAAARRAATAISSLLESRLG